MPFPRRLGLYTFITQPGTETPSFSLVTQPGIESPSFSLVTQPGIESPSFSLVQDCPGNRVGDWYRTKSHLLIAPVHTCTIFVRDACAPVHTCTTFVRDACAPVHCTTFVRDACAPVHTCTTFVRDACAPVHTCTTFVRDACAPVQHVYQLCLDQSDIALKAGRAQDLGAVPTTWTWFQHSALS